MDNNEIVVEMSESAGVGEPGVHSTPVNRSKEFSLTESAIDDSGTLSTPTSTKCNKLDNDMMSVLLNEFDKMNCKYDKLNCDVSEVKSNKIIN